MVRGPALLGELRDDLLDQVLGLLQADRAVAGAALVGSLGRGDADNWSDLDLLILMEDEELTRFAEEPAARPWAQADLLADARHNAPAGAMSAGATYLRAGLPVRVDLYVYPATRTRWPTGSRPVFERRPVGTASQSFDQLNASGTRQAATAKTADEVRQIHLSYVPIAGKYVARRTPSAREMIRFLGQAPDSSNDDPAAQLLALRAIADGLSDPSWAWLGGAVSSYLDLVEEAL